MKTSANKIIKNKPLNLNKNSKTINQLKTLDKHNTSNYDKDNSESKSNQHAHEKLERKIREIKIRYKGNEMYLQIQNALQKVLLEECKGNNNNNSNSIKTVSRF